MGERSNPSPYVKLNKAQKAPLEDIKPGELNQPIQVPQLAARRCSACGHALPQEYVPPADEPWTTGIFACAEDRESCLTGLFCPCVLYGRNVSLGDDNSTRCTRPCICHAVFVEGGIAVALATTAAIFSGLHLGIMLLLCEGLLCGWSLCGVCTSLVRLSLQKKYHLKNSPCGPCCVHCCFHWCALCQEHREMKLHLPDGVHLPTTTAVNPPPVQEMKYTDNSGNSAVSSSSSHEHDKRMEMQAMKGIP